MGRVSFIPDNIIETGNNYPRLKLEKDEQARVCVLEDATRVFAHTLQYPIIGTDGKPLMKTIDTDDGPKKVFEYKFLGYFKCFGDEDELASKEKDARKVFPEDCPMCAESMKGTSVRAPEPRYGAHVAKYATKQGGYTIKEGRQFSVEIMAWIMSNKLFTKLANFQAQAKVPLAKMDILLDAEGSGKFVRMVPSPANGPAEWLATEDRQQLLAEAFEEDKCDDLEALVARSKDKKWIEQDLVTIREAWAAVNGETPKDTAADAASQLDNLITNGKSRPVPVAVDDDDDDAEPEPVVKPRRTRAPKVTTTVDLDDDDEGSGDESEPVPAREPVISSFDKMMAGLPGGDL